MHLHHSLGLYTKETLVRHEWCDTDEDIVMRIGSPRPSLIVFIDLIHNVVYDFESLAWRNWRERDTSIMNIKKRQRPTIVKD